MTNPGDDLLATSEGVDEGSAASTDEGPGSGSDVGTGAPGAASQDTAAPPVDMESDESRAARDAAGTGQQLQEGEG